MESATRPQREAPPGPPAPDPARQQLADAIVAHNAAAARVEAIAGPAQDAALDAVIAANDALKQANDEVAEAEGSRANRLIDEVTGVMLDTSLSTVPELEQRVERARLAVERAHDLMIGLRRESQTAQYELATAERRRAAALAEVTRQAPEVHRLHAELAASRMRTATLEEVLRLIDLIGQPERNQRFYAEPVRQAGDAHFVGVWREALAALKIDPETRLPGEDDG